MFRLKYASYGAHLALRFHLYPSLIRLRLAGKLIELFTSMAYIPKARGVLLVRMNFVRLDSNQNTKTKRN